MKKMNVTLIGFFDTEGKILLNQRRDAATEMWELVGGSIEQGETPEIAIKREIKEELNYSLSTKDKLQFKKSFKYTTDTLSADVHYFTALYPGIDKFRDSDEVLVADLHRFTIDQALALVLLPMTRKILEEVHDV